MAAAVVLLVLIAISAILCRSHENFIQVMLSSMNTVQSRARPQTGLSVGRDHGCDSRWQKLLSEKVSGEMALP